jgi:membrane protein implicated in regulation of membrane protease activity
MSFDAWVVAFGLASLLLMLGIANGAIAVGVFSTVAGIDIWLLYRFFRSRRQPAADFIDGAVGSSPASH